MSTLTLIVRCVGCGHRWDASHECDVPMCPQCFSPGVAESATTERPSNRPPLEEKQND